MSACKEILINDRWARGTNGIVFDLANLDAQDQTNLLRAATSHWTPGTGYWLRTNNLNNAASRQIAVFCDGTYDNVPQPAVWNLYHRNPAHAVGYSDGTVGLISPAEFKALDRSEFISLTALATNLSQ